jgi:hypothetical protein
VGACGIHHRRILDSPGLPNKLRALGIAQRNALLRAKAHGQKIADRGYQGYGSVDFAGVVRRGLPRYGDSGLGAGLDSSS